MEQDASGDALERLMPLVDDDDRKGPSIHRLAYAGRLDAAYHEIEAAVEDLLTEDSWQDRSPEWLAARLRFVSLLTLHYARTGTHSDQHRDWGDRALALGAAGPPLSRAGLLLALSEVERAHGDRAATAAYLKTAAEAVAGLAPDGGYSTVILGEMRLRLGVLATAVGDPEKARQEFESVLEIQPEPMTARAYAQLNLALLAGNEGRLEEALDLESEAAETAFLAGDHDVRLWARNNKACTLQMMGQTERAYAAFLDLLPDVLWESEPAASLVVAEDFATVLVGLDRYDDAAVILGAVAAGREQSALPREPHQQEAMAPVESTDADALGDRWTTLLDEGRALTLREAVSRVTG